MSMISSYLVVLCLILLSRGTIRVDTEVPHVRTTEDEVSGRQDVQDRPTSGVVETLTDSSLDVSMMPQEPYPQIIEDLDIDEDSMVTPTPTLDDQVLSVDAGSAAAAAPLDIDGRNNMDYTIDSSKTNQVSQTGTAHSDIDKTRDEETNKLNVIESSQTTVNGESLTNSEANILTVTKEADPPVVSDVHHPDINQIMDEMMQTQIYDPDRVSHQLPSSEGESYSFNIPLATEALRHVNPGTWDDHKQSVLMEEKTVDPQFKLDAVVPTQFSLEDDDENEKGEEEFPTFDKWSMQYLAEQEKQKIKNKQEQAVPSGTLLAQKQLRRNFAAISCGAKVVTSNPEAENVNFVLNRNPDEYMLSPCKAKKWFVVELCEPLQIHKVELGTTELFASQPKSFRISASQRYPTKEWMPIGKFDMSSERTIHSFNTPVNEEFVKFVRVEMLEHHGVEYYCPISTFRVMGVDIASDEDDDNNNESMNPDGEGAATDGDEDEVEESVNLFTSAKDAVVKLVRKVLFKDEPEEGRKEELPAIDNATAKVDEKTRENYVPCSEKSTVTIEDSTPTVHIPEAGHISHPPAPEEPKVIPIVTKLADTEQLPMVTVEMPIIIKLEKDADSSVGDCELCDTPDKCLCSPWNIYLQMMTRAYFQTSTCPVRSKTSMKLQEQSSFETNKPAASSTDGSSDQMSSQTPGIDETKHIPGAPETGVLPLDPLSEADRKETQSEAEKLSVTSAPRLHVQNGDKVISTAGHQQKPSGESTLASQVTSFSSAGVTVARSETLDPSSLFGQNEADGVTLSLVTPDLNIQQSQVVEQGTADLAETIFLKVSPTPTLTSEDSMEGNEDIQIEAPTVGQKVDQKGDESVSQPPLNVDNMQGQDGHFEAQASQNVSDQARSQTLDKDGVSSTAPKASTRSIDLVTVGMSSSSKRDMTIMKLNNRIMALEQNVSMTKRYLEELSRAFKQQNEDMMKLLNKTEKRLSAYMIQSEEKQQQHQSHIDILELKVTNLTQIVDTMHIQLNALGKELRGAQFLLTVFQVVLFLWLMITSYRGRGKSPLVYTDHQFLLDTMPTKPTFERTEKGSLQRRNSDIGMQSGLEQGGPTLKRQVSEANLVSAGGGGKQQSAIDSSGGFLRDSVQGSKKRKKKKLKQVQLSVDSVTSLSAASISGNLPAQSSSFSSCAGVLFGTDASYKGDGSVYTTRETLVDLSDTFKDTHNITRSKGQAGYQKQFSLDSTSGQPCFLATGLKHGLWVEEDLNTGDVSYSALPTAPMFQYGVNFLGFGSVPDVDRIERIQFNDQQSISRSSLADTTVSTVTLQSGPEFKLPSNPSPEFKLLLHPRHKIRKLADKTHNGHQGCVSCRNVQGRASSLREELKRRRSTGFINPNVGGEFFLAENYMSENRFKFPSSPANDAAAATRQISLGEDLYKFGAGLSTNGSAIEENLSCPLIGLEPLPSTLYKRQLHSKSTPSLYALSSSQATNLKSLPHASYSNQSDHNTTQTSFISAKHIPQSLSQLSSGSLIRATTSGHRGINNHQAQYEHPLETHTQENLGPVIPSSMKISFSVPEIDNRSHQHSQFKGNISHPDDDNANYNRQQYSHQTHRRQISLPTTQFKPSRNFEKEQAPGARKGLFEDSKHLSKSSSVGVQVPNVKRLPSSSFNKKSLGGKLSVTDGSTHLPSHKKGP